MQRKIKRARNGVSASVVMTLIIVMATSAFAQQDYSRQIETSDTYVEQIKNQEQVSKSQEGSFVNTEDDSEIYVDPSVFEAEILTISEDTYRELTERGDNLVNAGISGWLSTDETTKEDYESYYDLEWVSSNLKYAPIETWVKSMSSNKFDMLYDENQGLWLDSDRLSYLKEQSADNYASAVKEIENIDILEDDTEMEKVQKILLYMKDKATYDESSSYARSFFNSGYANCNAYAEAFYDLCQIEGIDCVVVLGNASMDDKEPVFHSWNAVKINGELYFSDPCWYDHKSKKNRKYALSKTL